MSLQNLLLLSSIATASALNVCGGGYGSTMQAADVPMDCEQVSGNLAISRTSWTDLQALKNLQSVTYDLVIEENDYLTSLDGFNITWAGDVRIQSNPVLLNLDGLSNLRSISYSLAILFNPKLNSISGLSKMTAIWDDLTIWGSFDLHSFDGLHNLERVDNLHLQSSGFHHLDLAKLTYVGGDIFLRDLHLKNLDGFPQVDIIRGDLELYRLHGIPNLNGLSNLRTVTNFKVQTCDYLSDMSGVANLATVYGEFVLTDLPKVTTLSGFKKLYQISSGVRIQRCDALKVVDFPTLAIINYGVQVQDNKELTSINGLRGVIHFRLALSAYIFITGNPKLADLNALSGLDYIKDQTGLQQTRIGVNGNADSATDQYWESYLKALPNTWDDSSNARMVFQGRGDWVANDRCSGNAANGKWNNFGYVSEASCQNKCLNDAQCHVVVWRAFKVGDLLGQCTKMASSVKICTKFTTTGTNKFWKSWRKGNAKQEILLPQGDDTWTTYDRCEGNTDNGVWGNLGGQVSEAACFAGCEDRPGCVSVVWQKLGNNKGKCTSLADVSYVRGPSCNKFTTPLTGWKSYYAVSYYGN